MKALVCNAYSKTYKRRVVYPVTMTVNTNTGEQTVAVGNNALYSFTGYKDAPSAAGVGQLHLGVRANAAITVAAAGMLLMAVNGLF